MATILLADDSKNIREFCRRELEDEGYRVILASNGREAVVQFREHAVDLVVLDIAMPVMDGFQALQDIRAIDPVVPAVFFTSYDESCVDDPRAGLATACVEKSGDLAELKRVIATVLRGHMGHKAYHAGLPPMDGLARADATSTAIR